MWSSRRGTAPHSAVLIEMQTCWQVVNIFRRCPQTNEKQVVNILRRCPPSNKLEFVLKTLFSTFLRTIKMYWQNCTFLSDIYRYWRFYDVWFWWKFKDATNGCEKSHFWGYLQSIQDSDHQSNQSFQCKATHFLGYPHTNICSTLYFSRVKRSFWCIYK